MSAVHYKGYTIEHEPKPIPDRYCVDWNYCHDDYDGPEDRRCGNAGSLRDCMDAIDEIEDDS